MAKKDFTEIGKGYFTELHDKACGKDADQNKDHDEILNLEEGIKLVNDLKHKYPDATEFELIIRAFQQGYEKACDDVQYIEAL